MLRRSGCKDEKIGLILDEANVMNSGFRERMNTLQANGEVPGLLEGDEHTTLRTQCKEGGQRQGLMLDTDEEQYKWFTQQVKKNLHVVRMRNPSTDGHKGQEFTSKKDLDQPSYQTPDYCPVACPIVSLAPNHRDAVVNTMVFAHQSLHRHVLDYIQHLQTRALLAVLFFTLARVYYLLAGPRLAQAHDSDPAIKNNNHRYVRQLNLVLRLMYERYFFHIYRIYALQCFCSIFATYLLHICSILLHIAPYCYIFAPYLLHICKILMCLFVSQWQNQRSHAINKQL